MHSEGDGKTKVLLSDTRGGILKLGAVDSPLAK